MKTKTTINTTNREIRNAYKEIKKRRIAINVINILSALFGAFLVLVIGNRVAELCNEITNLSAYFAIVFGSMISTAVMYGIIHYGLILKFTKEISSDINALYAAISNMEYVEKREDAWMKDRRSIQKLNEMHDSIGKKENK